MLELLAPAGSPEAVRAAVHAGADALYLGYGDFNARRNAKNFSQEELAAAVSYCHLHGVKVYLTLNTLLTDRELPAAAQVAREVSRMGADAVLVQDLGVVDMLRQAAPDLPVHASTQMTVHNLDGVKRCADLGMTRAVLSRELSKADIAYICEHSPIEIETFVHGALCMCYSGQCYLSSVIGGRSGNRGLCAQPCRLQYGWEGKADSYPLSLKDMSLAGHLKELADLGVACAKIEGRMKRPEYVYVVTEVYARAIREGKDPTAEDLQRLEAAFSRQGFTDSYFLGEKGPHMFGVREDASEPKELFDQARSAYSRGEFAQRVPVSFTADVKAGEPVRVSVSDGVNTAAAVGDVPEAARKKEVTAQDVETQLVKTGGTPYLCEEVTAQVEPGLALPLSALNRLRREALEGLSARRTALPERRHGEFVPAEKVENRSDQYKITISLQEGKQLTPELVELKPELIYFPVGELIVSLKAVKAAIAAGVKIVLSLPRICTDREMAQLKEQLKIARILGIDQVLVGDYGLLEMAKELGFGVRGDFGLPVFNSGAQKMCKDLGLQSVTASFELKLAQIRDLSKAVDTELIAYGRLPLMIMENCIIKNRTGECTCRHPSALTDRKGARFPVVTAQGCRNEILNCNTLFLADKEKDYRTIGLWAIRLRFTTESPEECVAVTRRYLEGGDWVPEDMTRGLYYRDVE